MSTTEQQAAAADQNLTDEQKKQRILLLQQQIDEAQAKIGAPNPAGKGYSETELRTTLKETPVGRAYKSWLEEKSLGEAQLPQYSSQYDALIGSASPEVRAYAETHPATPYEIQRSMAGKFAENLNTQQRKGDLDYQRREIFQQVLKDNPNADIDVIAQLYNERVDVFNKNIPNVSTNYEATLAATQAGFNVGSGISDNLPETFQKDFDKRFGEHNKFIGLTENITTERAKQINQTVTEPPTITPQNPRPHILTGQPDSKYANPEFAQKGSDKYQGIKTKPIELVENINAITGKPVSSAAPRTENLSGTIFGIAPKKPRSLTQEQVNALSPAAYAEYRKEFENYNQYVTYQNEKIKQQNAANILVNREQFERNRQAFAKYISEAKAAGIQYVNIETKSGVQTVPIGQALQKRGITGISSVPRIPEGFTGGYIAGELIAIPEGRQFVGPEKPVEQNYLKNFGTLIGAEALSTEKVLPKYYNEPSRVTSNEKLVASKQIVTSIENIKSPLEKTVDFIEGLGTGALRTGMIGYHVAETALVAAQTKNPFVGEEVLQRHEEELKKLGVGPSVIPTIETGKPTGRSAFYNVGELVGEVGALFIPLKGEIKNPFSKAPIKPKVPQTEAPEIAKTPSGIKGYPVAKLRDQGYGERPTLERGVVPKEEFNIKKAMNIPEPFVQEAGTVRGAKDYGNLREQIENVPRPIEETTAKPVELEPFYNPKVEVRRAPEPNTFRVDESAMFGKDITPTIGKTEVPLGEGPLVKVEESKGPLGGSIIKQVVAAEPFRSEYVPLGAGRVETALARSEGSKLIYEPETKGTLTELKGEGAGSEIEFSQFSAGSKTLAYTLGPDNPFNIPNIEKKIFLNPGLKKESHPIFENPEHTGDILSHETIHNVLQRIEGNKASENFDNLFQNYDEKNIGLQGPDYEIPKFAKIEEVNLGEGRLFKVAKQSESKPVEFDTTYSPSKNLPKTRAEEIKTYRVQHKDILGTVENPKGVNVLKDIFQGMKEPSVLEGSKKPSIKQGIQKAELEKSYPQLMGKKSFERSAIDAEKRRAENIYKFTKTQEISLGAGFGERIPARPPPYQHVGMGRGRTFFVSRSTGESGVKRFQPPKAPPPESWGGKGGQELLLEKPSETKGFTVTKVELGSTEKVGLVGAGGLAVAPAPLLILAETDENGNPITNGTQTNGTITNGTGTLPPIVNPPQEIDLTPSVLEPPTITEARPASKFGAAATTPSGIAYGLDALNARRSKNGERITVGPITGTKQTQETFAGFPNPSKQPSRLAQPGAFKQPQKEGQKFGQPFPSPQTPALKSPTPFPQPEKLKQPEPLFPKPPREPPISNFGSRRVKESRKEKIKQQKPDAFVGNVSDVDIGLGFNRKEITSGIKQSAKQYRKDTRFAYKRGGFTKLVTQKTGSVLSKKERSILEREKPKEVKRQKKRTGGFF